ncbi:hypothetical protein [Spongorhabdus nitratireducens]
MNKLLLAIGVAVSLSATANDFGGDSVQQRSEAQVQEQTVEHMAAEAQQHPNSNEFATEPQQETFVSVNNALTDYIGERKWGNKFEAGKFRILATGVASFTTRDPKRDPKFLVKRAQAASTAMLFAQTDIVKTIRTEMSASDQLVMPGSDIQKELGAEYDALLEEIGSLEYEAGDLAELLSVEERKELERENWDGRAEAFVDAVIKKIDASYDPSSLQQEQAEMVQDIKTRLNTAETHKKDLMKRAEAMKGKIASTATFSTRAVAEMPLYGIVSLATEEAWDPNTRKYEVGILVAWSQKHELKTRKILFGEMKLDQLSGTDTELRQYLANQEIASLIGPSSFTGKNGERWILGAAAAEIRGSNSKPAIRKADLLAQTEVAFSLYSYVQTEADYKRIIQETYAGNALNNETEMQAVESFSETMRREYKDQSVEGATKVYSYEVMHPITGKRTYISVYALSAMSSGASKYIEKINYAVNKQHIKQQKQSKAVKQQLVRESQQAAAAPVAVPQQSAPVKKPAASTTSAVSQSQGQPVDSSQGFSMGHKSDIDDDDF